MKVISVRTMIMVFAANLALSVAPVSRVFSQNATPADDPAKNKQIEDLKDRLATKVAELTEVRRLAIHGKVTAVTLTTLSVETQIKEVKIELSDGIRVIRTVKDKRSKVTMDDISKGDVVSVFGDYETQLDLLKAKVVVIENDPPERLIGFITAVDAGSYTITLRTHSGQSHIVDYEKTTRAFDWTGAPELVKSGFSKMKNGSLATVLGVPVPNQNNRLSAIRIINIGQVEGGVQAGGPETATGSAGTAAQIAD